MSDSTTSIPADDAKLTPKKRSWRWRFFRFVVLGFFGLVTLFVLFHAVENWRGKRAWEQYRKEQEAKGVSFDFNSIVPPPVPDDKNFAMTPLLKPMLDLNPPGTADYRHKDQAAYAKTDLGLHSEPWSENRMTTADPPHWRLGKRMNLKKWQEAIFTSTNLLHRAERGTPGDDILFAFGPQEAAMAELEQARKERPLARYDIKYEEEDKIGILLPHLGRVKGISQAFQLRAVARLSLGKSDEAFNDVNMIFTMLDSIESEPIMISKLVRHACFGYAMQTIWEGLVDHRWNQEQLVEFQRKIAGYDFIKDGYTGMQGERMFGNSTIEFLEKYPHMLDSMGTDGNLGLPVSPGMEKHLYKLIPKGWFRFEQISYNQFYENFILVAEVKDKNSFNLKRVKEGCDRMDKQFAGRTPVKAITEHRVISYMLMPSLALFMQRCAFAQSTADLAIVALALERYHLTKQDYPEILEALAPEYLPAQPVDFLVKTPFRYQRQSKDAFRLWSVGWNETDEGGKVQQVSGNAARFGQNEGDWTWPQVDKEPMARENGFE